MITPRTHRIAALALTLLALTLAGLAYFELGFIGFPDGALTVWDPTRKVLLSVFIGISLAASPWFALLGWRRKPAQPSLRFSAIAYLVLAALLFIADGYLQHGSGKGG